MHLIARAVCFLSFHLVLFQSILRSWFDYTIYVYNVTVKEARGVSKHKWI